MRDPGVEPMRDPGLRHHPRRLRRAVAALMSLGALAVGGGLGAAVGPPAAGAVTQPAARPVAVRVTPASGRPTQTFRVSIRRPTATGGTGIMRFHDAVTVSGPRWAGCVSAAQARMPDGPAGGRATVALHPRGPGAGWCRGTFTGVVVQSETEHCGGTPRRVCPFLVVAPRGIGHFRFRVS